MIRNQPVLLHVFNVLEGFEINYMASIETQLQAFLTQFQLDMTQFNKFPANPAPIPKSAQTGAMVQKLNDQRIAQIGKQNYIAVCFELQN